MSEELNHAALAQKLNARKQKDRLKNLRQLVESNHGGINDVSPGTQVGNHLHTTFSFSPYSPSLAMFLAKLSGLRGVGVVDQDSIGAAEELEEASNVLGMGATLGVQLQVNFEGSALAGTQLNSRRGTDVGHIVIHGVPHTELDHVWRFLKPVQDARHARQRKQVQRLNKLLGKQRIKPLDFEKEIAKPSEASVGGSVTGCHAMHVLAERIVRRTKRGRAVSEYLRDEMKLDVPDWMEERLLDAKNPYYLYDLTEFLADELTGEVALSPNKSECVSVEDAVSFANEVGGIPCYMYRGAAESPDTADAEGDSAQGSGDAAAPGPQRFEQSHMEQLVPALRGIGFRALSYSPRRNGHAELERLQQLCAEHGLMELSSIRVQSNRTPFVAEELEQDAYRHLTDSAWALIAHEKLSACNPRLGLFAAGNPYYDLALPERIRKYSELGQRIDRYHPERACEELASELQ